MCLGYLMLLVSYTDFFFSSRRRHTRFGLVTRVQTCALPIFDWSIFLAKLTHSSSVRAAIENEILAGLLAPGEVLDEEALAARFSVSRTPVREAVLQLIQSGLVEKESRRSATVAKLDLRRLRSEERGVWKGGVRPSRER